MIVRVAIGLSVACLAMGSPAAGQQQEIQSKQGSGSYKVRGDAPIRPSLIWDNGEKTFLDWPEGSEAPAIFAIDAGGNETLVNSYFRDGRFVIDAVYSRLLFRLDRLTASAHRKGDGA
jgi:type IV secretion system protein VirB9